MERGLRRCSGARKKSNVHHDKGICHATNERREDVLRRIRCWIRTVEDARECKIESKPCAKNLLCDEVYRKLAMQGTPPRPAEPFICNIPTIEVRPTSEKPELRNKSNPRVIQAFVPMNLDELPPWQRPRVHSMKLIGGNWWDMRGCFKRDGISDNRSYCPKDASGRPFKSFKEAIEHEMMLHDAREDQNKFTPTCCSPTGPAPENPNYKCYTCGVCDENYQWGKSGCGAPYVPPDEIAMYEGRPRKEGCNY